MKDETLLKLIEDAKEGIIQVSDFYAPEVFNYFLVSILYLLSVSIIFIMVSIIAIKVTRNSFKNKGWAYDDRDKQLSELGMAAYISVGMFILSWLVVSIFLLYDLLMFYIAPKIYITKEIVNLFK